MAKKISELPAASTPTDADLFPVVQAGSTKKQTFLALKTAAVGDNGIALAGLTLAANKGLYATGPGTLATFDLSAQGRTFLAATTTAAQRTAIGAAPTASPTFTGTSTFNGPINEATILTVASAAAMDLSAIDCNTISITGSASVATLGNMRAGTSRSFFLGAGITLVHSAANLRLPGAANILTQAGDTCDVVSIGTNVWAVQNYTRATGQPVTIVSTANGGTGNTTGLAATATALATTRSIAATGDATWSVNFNGAANSTGAITLAASGVTAGTYGSVTVNAKGLVTAALAATPVANGGTGATTATAAGTNLGTATVGTNTDQLARSSMVQAEIANKRPFTAYTPTVTASSGTYTTKSATGSYMVAFGICHFEFAVTITTKGTGATAVVTLPVAPRAAWTGRVFPCREGAATRKVGVGVLDVATSTVFLTAYDNTDIITGDGCVVYCNGSYPVA